MNLNNDPSEAQLRNLLMACDDDAGAHILWVDRLGEVIITLLGSGIVPAVWADNMVNQIQFRYETYERGNGYVGLEAAHDDSHVSLLFRHLIENWREGAIGYIDT